jgi:hypothetical protein
MKRKAGLIVLLVVTVAVCAAGCDRIEDMLGIGGGHPVPGPAEPTPGSGPYAPGGGPEAPGFGPGFRTLRCCEITDFKAGILQLDERGNFLNIKETTTVPYIPGTYMGIYFKYQSRTGKPIKYREEEFFPYPPQEWALWEGSEASYRTYPEENRATYQMMLAPGKTPSPFSSSWGFNPSGDPVGLWRWDIYFDDEYYASVTFDVVTATR